MKNFLPIISITAGILLPQGHGYAFLIHYFLMIMLFFVFLDTELNRDSITKTHLYILAVNIIVPVFVYYVIHFFDEQLAVIAFVTALAPTAAASTAVIRLLDGKVEFTIVSVLVTNIAIAVITPFLLTPILHSTGEVSFSFILINVGSVLVIPLAAAYGVKYFLPAVKKLLSPYKDVPYYLLIINVYLAVAKANDFLSTDTSAGLGFIINIGIIVLVICVFYFWFGMILGGKNYRLEAGQSLGQKNNSYTVWLALTFVNPVAAIGPVFYILYHNMYISYQLYSKNKASA